MDNIQFITPEFLMTVAGQILAVTALVAITRWLIGDRLKTIYYAVAWAILITLLVAFWAKLPADAQTAIVAVLNAVLLVLGAYGGNKAVVWAKEKRQGDTPEAAAKGAADDSAQRVAFSDWK